MLGDPWFQELRWVRGKIDELLRHGGHGLQFSASDEAFYQSLCQRELELLSDIRSVTRVATTGSGSR